MIEELVRRFYAACWNAWDDAAVERTLAEGFRFRGSLGRETVGRDGWRSYRDAVRAAWPDFHNDVVDLVAVRNRAAARLMYSGTHAGELLGIPGNGRHFTYAGAAFFTAEDGRLTEAWVLGDLEGLRAQLARTASGPARRP